MAEPALEFVNDALNLVEPSPKSADANPTYFEPHSLWAETQPKVLLPLPAGCPNERNNSHLLCASAELREEQRLIGQGLPRHMSPNPGG